MRLKTIVLIAFFIISYSCNNHASFSYTSDNLQMTKTTLKDSLRKIDVSELPNPSVTNKNRKNLKTPLMNRLWKNALSDIESNIVETPAGRYFGAGSDFGLFVYTRDISYSGILALNELYPTEMLSSLKVTRNVRLDLGLTVSRGYRISMIKGNWLEENLSEPEFIRKHKTNSYTRRTDDVIWLWAAQDLFKKNPNIADWEWLYDKGTTSFGSLYWPFFDKDDGLFYGQSSFIDIHFEGKKATGYPQRFSIADCVLIKALSTNCLYYQGMRAMAEACKKLRKTEEMNLWYDNAEKLKNSIILELGDGSGSFNYFKDKNGNLEQKRDALGLALVVLMEIVTGEDAIKCLKNYPESWAGIPIFAPFYPTTETYHNNTSWPFVDTFYLLAKEKAENEDYRNLNAAILARTCFDGKTFRELVDYTTKEPFGSGSQLWSAAAFLNVGLRNN